MPPTKIFSIVAGQTPAGVVPTAPGSYAQLTLSQNTTTGSSPILQEPIIIPLDNTGSCAEAIWFNDEQLPANTFYRVQIDTPNYGIVYDQNIPITGPSFNLASFIPGSQGSTSGAQVPLLQTNGTTNIDQRLLNLVAGSNITLTADSLGDVTIAAPPAGDTSVGLADSTGTFNVTGTPVTSAGTLTLSSFKTQTENTFLAAPNGSNGAPSFRAIVAADLPIAINSGTANQIAYYATTGTAVSGDSRLTDSGTELTYTGATGINIPSTGGYIFNNDTVISRLSSNIIGFGNGVGQTNGTIEAGEFYSPGGSVYTGGGGGVTTSSLSVLGATANFGTAGTTSGVITLEGSTSGSCTISGPAIASTTTNPIVFSNAIGIGSATAGTLSTTAGALQSGYSGASNMGMGDGTNTRRIPMTLYSGYGFAATGNVTSFTSLFATPTGSTGSLTLVANQQTVGSTLHICARGTMTVSTATQSCFFESRLKTGVLSEPGISLTTAAITWEYDSYTYCSAVGAAGVATMQTVVFIKAYSSTTIAANTTGAAVTTLSSTVDTTTTQLVDLLFAFGASEVGNTMTCTWAEVTLE